jgi:uncharacterized protein (DUF2141 family)
MLASRFIESLECRRLLAGTISGRVFDDLNGNGVREANEPGLAGQIIFIDLNFNGVMTNNEPRVSSSSTGSFTFTNRPNGIQRLRYNIVTGRRLTAPAAIFYDVAVANNTTSGRNFGSTATSVIVGSVFNDLNGNRFRDAGEPGLAGWTVFLDKDNDGVLDTNEKQRVTNSAGNYRFAGLTPGNYTLRIVQQAGWTRTAPLLSGRFTQLVGIAQSFSNRNFGQRDAGGQRP